MTTGPSAAEQSRQPFDETYGERARFLNWLERDARVTDTAAGEAARAILKADPKAFALLRVCETSAWHRLIVKRKWRVNPSVLLREFYKWRERQGGDE